MQGGMAPPPKKGMPWWGILLIVFGILAVLGIGAVVALVLWVGSNKDKIVEGTKKTMDEANAYAASHDQNACVDEALDRSSKCDGVWCTAQQQVFAQGCMQHAKPTPGFCDGVPKSTEIMSTANWIAASCQKRNRTDQGCRSVIQAIPQYCDHQRRSP